MPKVVRQQAHKMILKSLEPLLTVKVKNSPIPNQNNINPHNKCPFSLAHTTQKQKQQKYI